MPSQRGVLLPIKPPRYQKQMLARPWPTRTSRDISATISRAENGSRRLTDLANCSPLHLLSGPVYAPLLLIRGQLQSLIDFPSGHAAKTLCDRHGNWLLSREYSFPPASRAIVPPILTAFFSVVVRPSVNLLSY